MNDAGIGSKILGRGDLGIVVVGAADVDGVGGQAALKRPGQQAVKARSDLKVGAAVAQQDHRGGGPVAKLHVEGGVGKGGAELGGQATVVERGKGLSELGGGKIEVGFKRAGEGFV